MRVLLTGNTGYITPKWVEHAFNGSRVLIAGESVIKNGSEENITVFSLKDISYKELFENYDFDRIVVFSNQLTFDSHKTGELERLQQLIDACSMRGPAKLLYLDGPKMLHSAHERIISDAAHRLCTHAASESLQIHVLRIPWLYSVEYEDDYFHKVFHTLESDRSFHFTESPMQYANFLDSMDLAELIKRILENWPGGSCEMCVPDHFSLRFSDLGKNLKLCNASWSFTYDSGSPVFEPAQDDMFIRHHFGWEPGRQITAQLPQMYQRYKQLKQEQMTLSQRFSLWTRKHPRIIRFFELAFALALTVLCGKLAGLQTQFRMIDFRLLFVMLMGTMYDMSMGLLAATGASALLIYSYHQNGINWLTLFYEPANWLVFIFYFVVGIVCGYLRLKHKEQIHTAAVKLKRLNNRMRIIQDLYHDALNDKREYKKQIVSSKDSFGKIFAITQELNVTHEKEVFIQAISILEKVMENQSVEIYQVEDSQHKARLVAASHKGSAPIPVSFALYKHEEIMHTIADGEVYVNNHLAEDMPMYIAGLMHNNKIRALIALRDVEYTQMTLYYQNLFKILCGLISSALTRTLNIQEALREKQCMPGTDILRREYFEQELAIHCAMDEQKLAVYTLLRLDTGDLPLETIDALLKERTLVCDTVGFARDGRLYLILSQATQSVLPVIEKRFADTGIQFEQVSVEDIPRSRRRR